MSIIQFKDLPADSLSIRPAPAAGGTFWRVRRAETLTPDENGGLHHIFVRCFRDGQRVAGVPIHFFWPGGEVTGPTEEKPLQEWGDWNGALFGDWVPENGPGPYGIAVSDGKPSETFIGFGLPRKQHYTYRVEFEEVAALPPRTLPEVLRDEAARQRIPLSSFDPCTAAILRDGFAPASALFTVEHGGQRYSVQCAVRPQDGTQRVYYHPDFQPGDVRFI